MESRGVGEQPDHHLTTFAHDGRFWDVVLRFEEDSGAHACRARLRFVAAGQDKDEDEDVVETAVIIIEPSRDEAVKVAQSYDRYHLSAMLRSAT